MLTMITYSCMKPDLILYIRTKNLLNVFPACFSSTLRTFCARNSHNYYALRLMYGKVALILHVTVFSMYQPIFIYLMHIALPPSTPVYPQTLYRASFRINHDQCPTKACHFNQFDTNLCQHSLPCVIRRV